MKLTKKQIKALSDWAAESFRSGGNTAWGPKFDAAMTVARDIHAQVAPKKEETT